MLVDCTFALALVAGVVVAAVAAIGSEPPGWAADVLSPRWNREFGVLEGLQTFLLFGIALILLRGRGIATRAAGLVTALLLLEELDYMLHLWDWIVHRDVWRTDIYGTRNLHNEPWAQSYNNVGYALVALCVLGIATWRIVRPSTNGILPMRRPVAAAIASMNLALWISALFGRLYIDGDRQFFNETHELALYASAALIVCELWLHSKEPDGAQMEPESANDVSRSPR